MAKSIVDITITSFDCLTIQSGKGSSYMPWVVLHDRKVCPSVESLLGVFLASGTSVELCSSNGVFSHGGVSLGPETYAITIYCGN